MQRTQSSAPMDSTLVLIHKGESIGLHRLLSLTRTSPPLVLRVFRGAPTPTQATEPATLAVPALEKNFLISPPGSPPVGWEPVVEDPPNRDALASDLMEALRRLELSREGGVEVLVSEGEGGVPAVHLEGEWTENEQIARGSGITMVRATVASMGGGNSGIATPVGSGWLDGERVSVQRLPTARPPIPHESTRW